MEMKEFAAKVERDKNGDTVLNFATPINARVLELHFTPNTPVSLHQISARVATSEKSQRKKPSFCRKGKRRKLN